jgi:sterol desaturase/sphingolipid hydroxylase (fatty acid hydroxylase superfamily)
MMLAAVYNLQTLAAPLATFLLSLLLIGCGLTLERIRPVCRLPGRAAIFNVAYMSASIFIQGLISPLILGATAMVVSAFGGGLLVLPAEGLGLIPAALAYIVTLDLFEYLFHRAQHAIPALWSMHSLHHSDPAMNVSTTSRHFWLEQAIKSVTIYLAASLIFAAPLVVILIYAAVSYYNFFSHMNLRVGFGRFVLLNSPQYHRIHHSSQPLHRDKNFAGLFPIFDVVGGTHYMPAADEYPATGLDDGDCPVNLAEAIAWPARDALRRSYRQSASPAGEFHQQKSN